MRKKRILYIVLILIGAWVLLTIKLGWIQVVNASRFKAMAVSESTLDKYLIPVRGEIMDRNGNPLAINVNTGDVYAEVNIIKDKSMGENYSITFAQKLSKILNINQGQILKLINQKGAVEVLIKRKVPESLINEIKKSNLQGIRIIDSMDRRYPYNNFMSQILGFVGVDSRGLNGIEAVFDNYLYGRPGRIITQVDAAGRIVDDGTQKNYGAQKGYNVKLTIDDVIQHFAEDAVEKAYMDNNPKNVTAIVMNPKTGEILAMANKPDYNPNKPFDVSQNLWNEPAVTLNYEPGSVFKTITASAALDSGSVSLSDKFYCDGYKIVAGRKIHCWDTHGQETFVQGIQNSCNVVFMDVGQKLGKETLYKYINAFGFGVPTGIPLPGEEAGIINPVNKVGPVELATISFGQGISVTPIQMITAFSAVINGGNLMKPLIVKDIVSDNGHVVKAYKPQLQRQVISKQTSDTMRSLLESVVSKGTGQNAYIPGYRVGGKTGTTQGYTSDHYVASFAGFAPADDPKIAVLVVINQPKGQGYMGGQIAAPVAKDIIFNTLRYLGVKPVYNKSDLSNASLLMPDLKNLTLKDAISRLEELNLKYKVNGKGNMIIRQTPPAGSQITSKSVIQLYLGSK